MLTVQIGQCGNQLGAALFDKLAQEDRATQHSGGASTNTNATSNESAFFRSSSSASSDAREPRVARAVLIDMEPKVIQRCVQSDRQAWRYDARNTFTQQSGSGNNWAFGYMAHGVQHEDALLELLQAEAERCDRLQGFLTLQSVAGGTGSGLGSFLTEKLADAFPAARLLNAVVWPHAAGEVIVQNYNALLTMASLADVADGVLVLQNDTARAICQRLLRLARPSFDAMNDVLATHLAAAFLPVHRLGHKPLGGRPTDPIVEMCQQLCVHPGFKLLDIKTIPQMPQRSKQFSTHTWTGVLKHLHQMQVANAPLEEGIDWHISLESEQGRAWNRALGSMLVLRGRGAHAADVTAFHHPAMYASWSLQPFACYASAREFNAYDKSATLISNSKALLPTLASTIDKAYDMFSHGAYTHQYARHSVDDAFFQEAFVRIDQVVQNYQSL